MAGTGRWLRRLPPLPRPGGVEEFCTRLAEEAGVLLLPASIYRSELTPTPTDRFRIGIGRADPEAGLAALTQWMRAHR